MRVTKVLLTIVLLIFVALPASTGPARADDGSQPIILIDDGATEQNVPVPPDVTDPGDGEPGQPTSSTPPTSTTGDTTPPGPTTSSTTDTATVSAATPLATPPPPRGLYCHVVNGSWKLEDLVRDQEVNDPIWTVQGPWKDAYYDPATGIGSCDFPAPPEDTTIAATSTSANASTEQPAKAPSQAVPHTKDAVGLPPLSVPTTAVAPVPSKPVVAPAPKPSPEKNPTRMVGLPSLSTTPTG